MMDYQQLLMLWDQRIVLLTAVLNLTKQIEVQSRQEEIQLSDLPEQRQVYVDRLKKCNQMIDACQAKAAGEESARLKLLLSGKEDAQTYTEEERRLACYARESRSLLDSILALDTEARKKIRDDCDRLQNQLRSVRRQIGVNRRADPFQ